MQRITTVIRADADWVKLMEPVKARVATYKNGQWEDAGTALLPAGMVVGPEAKPK